MEIAFVGNILAYAAIADWSAIESHAVGVLRLWNRIISRIPGPSVLGFGCVLAFIYLWSGNPLQLPQEWDPLGVLFCGLSAFVAAVFLFGLVRDWLRKFRSENQLWARY